MPFASPFASISTPSFNPSYSNVPQNKPPKPAAIPQPKQPTELQVPESQESSIAELNSGITPHVFTPQAMMAPMPQQQQFMPVAMPQPFTQFMPAMVPPGMQRLEAPQMPQRLNPNRPIFV